MTTDSSFVMISAQFRPALEGRIVNALHDLPEFPGFTLAEVRGQGRGRGAGGEYRSTDHDLIYQRHLLMQIVCRADQMKVICDTIARAAWTGRRGDGVIFATDAVFFARIRETHGV